MRTTPYVFGPVPSRRLGRSLGVDLVPFKTCTFDCIYCQLGRTTEKTVVRGHWAPVEEVVSAVKERLSTGPDYVTLSGSGEPTLHLGIGEVAFEQLLEGLLRFRRDFRGQYWLEVFLVAELNATDAEIARLIPWVERIRPDRVQLNTVSRPPAESAAVAVPADRLERLAAEFRPPAEVIANSREFSPSGAYACSEAEILSLLRRRPCTLTDMADGLGSHPAEVVKHLERLVSDGKVLQTQEDEHRFYRHRDFT